MKITSKDILRICRYFSLGPTKIKEMSVSEIQNILKILDYFDK